MKVGHIPEKLKIVMRDKGKHKLYLGELEARSAFVTSAESPKTLETAKRWAGENYYRSIGHTDTPEILEVDNDPIPQLYLVGVEGRAEGGRAWKVFYHTKDLKDTLLVDLRDDVFLEALFRRMLDTSEGHLEIQGPFRWIMNGSQMRLALVDSDIYREIEEAGEVRKVVQTTPKVRIHLKDLVVGGVYANPNSYNWNVFVGFVRVAPEGKKMLAWKVLAKIKAPGCEIDKLLKYAFDASSRSDIYLSSSCSYSQCMGVLPKEELDKFSPTIAYADGYEDEVKMDRITWL